MKSKSKLFVKGLYCENLVNIFLKMKVKVFDFRRIDRLNFVMTVLTADESKVVAYLTEKCYNITHINRFGAKYLLEKFKDNLIIVIFCLITLAFIGVSSQFCLKINVKCSGDANRVVSCVNDYGINIGKNISSLDYDKLENYICDNVDSSMYAIVNKLGSTLFIEVIDKTTNNPPIDYNKSYDIIANSSGKISKMTVLAGTPLCKEGDNVKVGQILVKGVTTFKDGSTEPIRAIAEIFAIVESKATVNFNPIYFEYERSGNSITVDDMVVVKRFVESKRKILYPYYEIETHTVTLFPLNIMVKSNRVYELIQNVVTYKFEDKVEELKQNAYNLAKKDVDFEEDYTQYIIENQTVTAVIFGTKQINAEKIGG